MIFIGVRTYFRLARIVCIRMYLLALPQVNNVPVRSDRQQCAYNLPQATVHTNLPRDDHTLHAQLHVTTPLVQLCFTLLTVLLCS